MGCVRDRVPVMYEYLYFASTSKVCPVRLQLFKSPNKLLISLSVQIIEEA
jgi:hypothetical protein